MRLSTILVSLGFILLGIQPAAGQSVFINELHYDNDGADAGEAVEIAGPAGTNLGGYQITLYNGTSSQRSPYSTITLSGLLPDQDSGSGTLSFAEAGIQNGAPDGLALVGPDGSVVQFLSYEGTFTAASGPAAGMTSTDIGVEEGSGTPAGFSLQLTGTGTTYADFAWSGPTTDSFGAVNSDQSFGGDGGDGGNGGNGDAEPALVINEIDYDQPGTDAAEFVELYNATAEAIDLNGYTLQFVNGSNESAYETFALPATTLAPGAYFVLCGDAQSTPGCDQDVSPNTNLIQNGAPDAVALLLGGAVVDAVSYEGSVPGFVEGSGAGLEDDPGEAFGSISRFPDGTDTDQNNADLSFRCATPGAASAEASADCPAPGTEPPTGDPALALIHDVQGSGPASPLLGQTVIVEGLVVGDFQANDGDAFGSDLSGFTVQEEAADFDDDPATSEGLSIFTGNASTSVPDVQPGDTVRVTGVVDEFETSGGASSLTQLTSVSAVEVLGSGPVPSPTEVTLPVVSREVLEQVEGMLVRFPQALVISEYFNFDRFGEIVLTLPQDDLERPFQPTSYAEPGSPEAAEIERANALRRITLDDARTAQNPDPARHPNGDVFDLGNRFRGGDAVINATGILDDRFGIYRLQPTEGAGYEQRNPRPEQPADVGGSLKVATFNVLNYFNGDGQGGGFPTARGADTPGELERQTAKIVSAILGLDADIVGLIEIENDPEGETSALDDLVDALNAEAGDEAFAYVETGTDGTDQIKVALLYRPETVTPVGDPAVFEDPRFTDPNASGQQKNRPALAQTFREEATQDVLTVAAVHFKSKGSSCGPGGDDPQQGSCNATRTDAAAALVDWLAGDPTGSGDPDALIIGDLNAYDEEDPIDAIKAGPDGEIGTDDDYADLLEQEQGEFAYTYVFGGQFGYLDYALSNAALTPQVTGATAWAINADEPDLLDYDTTFKKDAQDALYEPNAYRASDHDPVLVGLDLASPAPEVLLADLIDTVQGLDLKRGQKRSLLASLEAAQRSLGRGNTRAARGQLGAFINKVKAKRGKKIDASTAGALIADARVILDRLREDRAQRQATEAPPVAATPDAFALEANAPNPFAFATQIRFALLEPAHVRLVIYDILGRVAAIPVDAALPAGHHDVRVRASALPAGTYFYQIEAGAFTATRRMVVVK